MTYVAFIVMEGFKSWLTGTAINIYKKKGGSDAYNCIYISSYEKSLNSDHDGHQFHQYQQNEQSPLVSPSIHGT
jgi:hypothetical protein